MEVQLDPSHLQALLIFVVLTVAMVLVWNNRQYLSAINTPFIDALTGRAINWLVALVILLTVVTAVLSVFGVTHPIRVLSAESLCYLAGAYALVRWAANQ